MEKIRQEKELSQNAFSKKIGISPSYYSDLKKGQVGPSFWMLYGIANAFPDLNLRWLLTGEGPMWVKSANELLQERIHLRVNDFQASYMGNDVHRKKEIQELIKNIRKRLEKDIQALNRLLAGEEEEEEEKLDEGEK